MTSCVIAVAAAYLVGAIPFGLIVARIAKGIDIRTLGSGNIGATNVGRVLGAKWGVFVLILDAFKGGLPTYLFPLVALGADDPNVLHLRIACGMAAVVGHMFPCWIRFRGGKGVATALGVILVVAPLATAVAFGGFVLAFAVMRIVSLSSILAAITFFVAVMWQLWPHPFSEQAWSAAVFAIAIPLLIIARHRSNIGRLLRGDEPRYRTGEGGGDQAPSDAT